MEKAYCEKCKYYLHWRNWGKHLDYHYKKGHDVEDIDNYAKVLYRTFKLKSKDEQAREDE